MRILCIADQIDPLVYSTNAKSRFKNIDIILCAGDLPMDYIDFVVSTLNKSAFFVFGNHNLQDFGYYHKVQDKKIKKAIYDYSFCHGAVYCGFKALCCKSIKIKTKKQNPSPLLIAGASGTMRYNRGLCQYTNLQMFFRLLLLTPRLLLNKLLYGRYLDIFLTHTAPRHIHDKEDLCHKGFECYNWFIKTFKPAYMVHGHIHLYDLSAKRITKVFDTLVVNGYSHFVIDFPPKKQIKETQGQNLKQKSIDED